MIRAGAHALWSYWARHRLQLVVVIIGLALATGLWTGVQAINAEARASYDRAATTLGQTQFSHITRNDAPLRIKDFVVLRRAGWLVSPLVQGTLMGTGIEVVGFDPFTAPINTTFPDLSGDGDLSKFLSSPGMIFAHPDTADLLPENVPPVRILETVPPGQIITDVTIAMSLLKRDTLSSILVLGVQPERRLPLIDVNAEYIITEPAQRSDMARLTDSFHLNLTAFGLLSFAVGLFIVYSAIGLAFEQRRVLFRTLRALGLSRCSLMYLLASEALVLATLGGGVGVVLGYIMAAALLPGVAATLSGLYGASVSGSLSLNPFWWLIGFGMAYFGAAVAVSGNLWQMSRLSILAPAMPRAWLVAGANTARLQAIVGSFLILLSLLLGIFGESLIAGFACLAAMLLGAALLVPLALMSIVSLLSRSSRGVISQWIWADTRQQIQPMSLALMALMLALAANVGVSTMVGSFRSTFTGWLDQRLASDLYITTRTSAEAVAFQEFVSADVESILPIVSADVRLAGSPGQVFGIKDHEIYRAQWPLLESVPDVWDRVAQGDGILVNEQLARREQLWTGNTLQVAADFQFEIVGVYSDYGNPVGQAFINYEIFEKRYPDITPLRFALNADNPSYLRDKIVAEFGLPRDNTINQQEVKAFSMQVFEQTFLITNALNVLTLGVAGFALWASLTTVAGMRLPQVAPVWALGFTRKSISVIEMSRSLLLAALTAVLAIPIGLGLAWILLAIVNVRAFGWRLPIEFFPWDWAQLFIWAFLAAALAAAMPMRKLMKLPPSDLLKVFANER
ncbi:FtsX-like permease family protein [Paracoccaceae bacterium]|nr:FtsX-like permease family protein [Paracoccaceae bacterium]